VREEVMMMPPAPYDGNFDIEDLERLEALAAYSPPPSFEEAFSRLSGNTDRAVAEEA
jgi:hypothetical protein